MIKRVTAVMLAATFLLFAVSAFAADQPVRRFGACEQYTVLVNELAQAEKGPTLGGEFLKATTITAGTGALGYGFFSTPGDRGNKALIAKSGGVGFLIYLGETLVERKMRNNKINKLRSSVEASSIACAQERHTSVTEARMWAVEDRDAGFDNAIEVAKIRSGGSATVVQSSLELFGAEQDAKFREFEARMSAPAGPTRSGDNNIAIIAANSGQQQYCNLFRDGEITVPAGGGSYRIGPNQCRNLPAGLTRGILAFSGSSFELGPGNGVQISNGVVKFYNPNQN